MAVADVPMVHRLGYCHLFNKSFFSHLKMYYAYVILDSAKQFKHAGKKTYFFDLFS